VIPSRQAFHQVLGRVAFMHAMNELLKRIEKEAPHKAARELENRIAAGEDKIKTAQDKASVQQKIDGLKADLTRLNRDYTIPHYVLYMIHALLDLNDRQAWPLTSMGTISVNLPGIINMAVEVSTELPF
jgi:hypothetical protein